LKNIEKNFSETLLQQIKEIANSNRKQVEEVVPKKVVECEPLVKEVVVYVKDTVTEKSECNCKNETIYILK
jgi:predicted nucleic acid binding AN1-type Zn finger protein